MVNRKHSVETLAQNHVPMLICHCSDFPHLYDANGASTLHCLRFLIQHLAKLACEKNYPPI